MKKQKIKVLAVITSLGIGGAEKFLLSLARNIDRKKFDLSVCSIGRDNKLVDAFKALNIQVFYLNLTRGFLPGIRFLSAISKVYRLARDEKIDLLHSHLGYANLVAKIVGRLAGVKVISTIHNVIEVERSLFGKVFQYSDRYTSFLTGMVVCVSEGVEKSFFRNSRVFSINSLQTQRKSFTIYNGVDLSETDDLRCINRDTIRRQLGLSKDDLVIAIVARLVDWKGHGSLVDAMRKVVSIQPTAKLLIIGKGPLEGELRKKVRDLNLSNHICFLGVRMDIFQMLYAIDLFVLPYNYTGLFNGEGVGISILEAMACRKPIVTTKVSGISRAIIDGITGITVPQGDSNKLSTAILELLNDPDKAQRIGKNARELVERKFSISKTVRQYEYLYEYLYNQQNRNPKL